VFSRKVRLRLHETLDHKGRLDRAGVHSVERAVAEAVAANPRQHGPEVFAFATSVIRDAPNRDAIIARVARTTGTRLRVLTGEEEARLAYVAARQWADPTAGPLLVLDIGGGTLEIASGTGDQPDTVHSLPLGAGRITRDWLPGNTTPSPHRLAEIRRHLRRSLGAPFPACRRPSRACGCWPAPKPSNSSPGSPQPGARHHEPHGSWPCPNCALRPPCWPGRSRPTAASCRASPATPAELRRT